VFKAGTALKLLVEKDAIEAEGKALKLLVGIGVIEAEGTALKPLGAGDSSRGCMPCFALGRTDVVSDTDPTRFCVELLV